MFIVLLNKMNTPKNSKLNPKKINIGLVLTGGGARAAYQAGAIKGIAQVLGPKYETIPFHTLAGISAGAINVAYLASRATGFQQGTEDCYNLWKNLKSDQILRTDLGSLSQIAARWMRDLSLGGLYNGQRTNYLLDTSPLSELLRNQVDLEQIEKSLKSGILHGIAFSATNYQTGAAVTFFDGDPRIQPWTRSARIGRRAQLSHAQILASASIPILFQPVKIGRQFYGDGGIRLRTPLSPVIHMGADRIVAIGIRYSRPEDMTQDMNEQTAGNEITIADIAGVLLNAAFMDALESDIERLVRINHTLTLLTEEAKRKQPSPLREVPLLVIRPSQDLSHFASDQFHRFPKTLRHLLKGIGASDERGWDLLSYLAFDQSYTTPLLELGVADALSQKEEIKAFFSQDSNTNTDSDSPLA